MAQPTVELITALRQTAQKLQDGLEYRWTHQGSCNCGHLAQTITNLTKQEIHSRALESEGDWSDHANNFCPTSGKSVDEIIMRMVAVGLNTSDIAHLERLSSPFVLKELPAEQRNLDYRKRDDVVLYMNTMASMLEEQLLRHITLPEDLLRVREQLLEQSKTVQPTVKA
jgi:hypothetical protein